MFESLACPLAEKAKVSVEIRLIAQLIEQSDCMPGRMGAAGFLIDQYLAENPCP